MGPQALLTALPLSRALTGLSAAFLSTVITDMQTSMQTLTVL